MKCLEKDLAECLTCLRFPQEQQQCLRTANFLKRTFRESRGWTHVILRLLTEWFRLALAFVSLITMTIQWCGIRVTRQILRRFKALRQTLSLPVVAQDAAYP